MKKTVDETNQNSEKGHNSCICKYPLYTHKCLRLFILSVNPFIINIYAKFKKNSMIKFFYTLGYPSSP